MGFRYLVEDLPFQPNYLKSYKNYSVKMEDSKRINSFDKLLDWIRDDKLFLLGIDKAIAIFKLTDYTRAKGAYSNPITQDYIKLLQENNNDATN